jgi:predicted nucleic acid-binding protein
MKAERKSSQAFWDASAIVPLCVHEAASMQARAVLRKHPQPIVWWGTLIESRSALARAVRERILTVAQKNQALRHRERLSRAWTEILPTEQVRDMAINLLDAHSLRTGDALQLAAALVWCDEKPHRRVFVSYDKQFADAARQLGFASVPRA